MKAASSWQVSKQRKRALQMFGNEVGNALSMFVKPHAYAQCVLVRMKTKLTIKT